MIHRSPPNQARRYGVAVGTFAFALAANYLVKQESPFVLFLAAVMVSAWYGGLGPGLLTTLAAAVASNFLFLEPIYIYTIPGTGQSIRLLLFAAEGVAITLLTEAYKRKEMERAQAEAMQNQLRMVVERKQDLVTALSEGFLQKNPRIPGFEAAFFYQPSSREDMVGGDCFDFFPFNDRQQGIFLGDVCGKGLSAAVYTSKTKYMLEAYAIEDPAPHTVVTRLNRALCRGMSEEGRFVSLIYGVLDSETAEFTYTNAGHPLPILYDPSAGQFQRLEETGGVIGADEGMSFRSRTVTLSPGALLLLYTDGITEAMGSEDPYADGGLSPLIQKRAEEGAEPVARAIFNRARRMAERNRRDDMAIIAIRRVDALPDEEARSDQQEALA